MMHLAPMMHLGPAGQLHFQRNEKRSPFNGVQITIKVKIVGNEP